MKSAAFFDMDRTLIRANTGSLWIRHLRARGEISRWKMLQALGWVAQYKLAILDMEAITTRLIADMAGQLEQPMIEKCLDFAKDQVFPTIAPRAREQVAWHREQGHLIAILSSATPYVTEPVGRHLGIEHIICTRLSVQDGKFDGSYLRPACYGSGKVHWAEAFAREQAIDLAQSFFYTDSYSDLPMLERVGEARVVNPDPRLRRHARKRGWSVEAW